MRPTNYSNPTALPCCCTIYACKYHYGKAITEVPPQIHSEEDFALDVFYKRFVIKKQGNLRLKDLPFILTCT